MTFQLSNAQLGELRTLAMDAYPDIPGFLALGRALTDAGFGLARFAALGAGPEQMLHDLLRAHQSKTDMPDVIGAIQRGAPRHSGLADFQAKLLHTVAAGDGTRLEGMVVQDLNYRSADAVLRGLGEAFGWVCRIERTSDEIALGTGVLVADDLILTNYHVMYGVPYPGEHEPRSVQARFDMIGAQAGRVRSLVSGSWLLDQLPPGGSEWGSQGDPPTDCLDFVLLRLAEPAGRDAVGGRLRGYARFSPQAAEAIEHHPLIVLQHPGGAPLQVCFGSVTGMNETRTRLHHNATTQRGSSGSPCLSTEMQIVGLHNGGVAELRNTAVPNSLLVERLATRGWL